MRTQKLTVVVDVSAASAEQDRSLMFIDVLPKGGRECSACAWEATTTDEEREHISVTGPLCDAHCARKWIDDLGIEWWLEQLDGFEEMVAHDGTLRVRGVFEWTVSWTADNYGESDDDFDLVGWELSDEPDRNDSGSEARP